MWNKQRYCWQLHNHVWIQNVRRSNWKITMLGKSAYFFVVLWYGRSCQEMCGTILWVSEQNDSTTLQSINSLHWWPSFQWRRIEIRGRLVKSMLSDCPEMFILGTYWTTRYSMVNEQTCTIDYKMDQSMWRKIISFDLLHSSCMWLQTILSCGKHCKTMQIRTVSRLHFAADLEDSKFTSGGTLCIFGSHTFAPISWMCKKQTSDSHRSTESEIISLDAGLRLDGIHALDLWELIVAILHGNTYQNNLERRDPYESTTRKKIHGKVDDLDNVDFLSSNVNSSHKEALVKTFEDNEAVIKMIIKGRSPTMKHASRTHRFALDLLFDRINLHPKIQIEYIDTKNQLADMLTKGNFTRDGWNHLLCLYNISHFSSIDGLEAMSKRTPEDAGEEWVTAKSKPMMNLVSRYSVRDPNVLASTALESPVKTKSECQNVPLSSLNVQQTSTGDPYWAPAHQTTQNGTLTKSGLLKYGNLVKCREQVRWDP